MGPPDRGFKNIVAIGAGCHMKPCGSMAAEGCRRHAGRRRSDSETIPYGAGVWARQRLECLGRQLVVVAVDVVTRQLEAVVRSRCRCCSRCQSR
jgi:hypothetical protein